MAYTITYKDPVTGKKRAKEIIEKYIIQGEQIEGEILISFKTIDD